MERWLVLRKSPKPTKYKVNYFCSEAEARHEAEKLSRQSGVEHVVDYHPWTGITEGEFIFPPGRLILKEKAADWQYAFKESPEKVGCHW